MKWWKCVFFTFQAAPAPDLLDMSDPPPAAAPTPAPSLSDVDLLGPTTSTSTPSTSLPQASFDDYFYS